VQFTRPFISQAGLTFTTIENQLIDRFNPLAGAPVALAGVPGFSSGTVESPFELEMRAESSGLPQIAAGPVVAFAGSSIEFDAINPASTVYWDFGDSTLATSGFAAHAYATPGVYRVNLFSPAESIVPQDTVTVIVLPCPGNAPARPADLDGEPTGLHPLTAGSLYQAHLFQPFISSGGAIPAHKVGTDPVTGADRYISDITPQTVFGVGETNTHGAAYVSAMPLQTAYSATMDIDLAPHGSPADSTRPFQADGFVPLASPGFDASININNRGFKEEDFNYALLASLWENTRAADGAIEYSQDMQNGLIVWGNALTDPDLNYATQTVQAQDGATFSYALDDEDFHPHPGTTQLTDLATHQTVAHLRVTCSLGAPILTAPLSAASIKPAKLRRIEPENTLDPELHPSPRHVARNLYYQLQTGILGISAAP
jgi:hypothetical protein